MKVVSEYNGFRATLKSVFKIFSKKVEKMPIFWKSNAENEKIVTMPQLLFSDLYDLETKLFFLTVPYGLLYISVQFDPLDHMFSVSNMVNCHYF